jgi:hypothetical protein
MAYEFGYLQSHPAGKNRPGFEEVLGSPEPEVLSAAAYAKSPLRFVVRLPPEPHPLGWLAVRSTDRGDLLLTIEATSVFGDPGGNSRK